MHIWVVNIQQKTSYYGSRIGVLGGFKKKIGQASPDRSESKYYFSFNLHS